MSDLRYKIQDTIREIESWPLMSDAPISRVTAIRAVAFFKTILNHDGLKVSKGHNAVVFEWDKGVEYLKITVEETKTTVYGESDGGFFESIY